MNHQELTNYIGSLVPEAKFEQGPQFLTVNIAADMLHHLCQILRDDDRLAFDYLFCLSGVDMPDHMRVVYHRESTRHNHTLVVRTRTADREQPVLDTVNDIWPTAGFHEREVYDLLGLQFKNHPDLRRLFLDDTWGFPLRKDYTDAKRIVER